MGTAPYCSQTSRKVTAIAKKINAILRTYIPLSFFLNNFFPPLSSFTPHPQRQKCTLYTSVRIPHSPKKLRMWVVDITISRPALYREHFNLAAGFKPFAIYSMYVCIGLPHVFIFFTYGTVYRFCSDYSHFFYETWDILCNTVIFASGTETPLISRVTISQLRSAETTVWKNLKKFLYVLPVSVFNYPKFH